MLRYVHRSLFFFFFFLFFFFLSFLISFAFSQLSQNQRNIMISLSTELNTSHWNSTDPNPCNWEGVNCTNSSITHISLYNLGLSNSSFLVDFCRLDSIRSLDLSNNLLSSIPDDFNSACGKLDGLKLLNFSNNGLSGSLPILLGFSSLEFLDLSYNSLSGNIASQLDGLVGLKSLNLSHNSFSGSVPTKLGKGMALEELQLSRNQFKGQIPKSLTGYGNLTLLDLSFNNLVGSVPDEIGKLNKLETLVLSSNQLIGEIPQSLSTINTLFRFGANQNKFRGTIPLGITDYVSFLDLSYNQINGSIPSNFLSSLKLQSVDLSSNLLAGLIPMNISRTLFRLRLSNNRLDGSIPLTVGLISNLVYLEVEGNNLAGKIPVELGNCANLTLLNLARNHLVEDLPKELGNLHQLVVMSLQMNRLTGKIPDEYTQFGNLITLNLGHNFLTGAIPSGISGLQKLTSLNLEGNQINGSIPGGIGALKSLLEIQLGNNGLIGPIPTMPLTLQIALNLSSNHFQGPIPDSLCQLAALEILDLSYNEFMGEVPNCFPTLISLTQLVLSDNQLWGSLPQFSQRVIVNATGNNDLNIYPSPISPTNSTKKRNHGPIVAAIASAVLGAGVVTVILLVALRRFYRVIDESPPSGEHVPQIISGHLVTTNFVHRSGIDFTKAMEAVSNPANIILKSRFSTYYKALMPSGTSYCVKMLNWSDKIFQLGNHEKFGQELEILGKLSNSRVMSPLAYILTPDRAYLFYAYAHKGTLFDSLHKTSEIALDWPCRYSIAIGVAQGLAFLHGCADPVLLLDLSSKTILLKSMKEPQLGDIELCKVIDPSKSTGSLSTVAGSVGYIPPEYAYTMRVTMPGNVYSFGVVLLELLTGKPPVSEDSELNKWVLSHSTRHDAWYQILDPSVSKTSQAFSSQMLSVLKVALACVSSSPEARPKMKSVVRMLLNAR